VSWPLRLAVELWANVLNSRKFNCLAIPATGRALPEEGTEHSTARRRIREEKGKEKNDNEKN